MKTETRQKTVNYTVFVSEDGKEFNNKKDCIYHEKLISGKIKKCPDCKGEGKIFVEEKGENYHTGAPETYTYRVNCKTCNGKGYLEKKTKIVWE